MSVEVCWSLKYLLRLGYPNLSLGAGAGMDTSAAHRDRSIHHLVWVLANHNLSVGGLLRRTAVGDKKYSNCVEADDGDHAV
jgi:hypothetical protein